MTDSPTPTTTRTLAFVGYQVCEREGKKSIWTRIGSTWPQADGMDFNVQLDALPIDGKVTLRAYEDQQE